MVALYKCPCDFFFFTLLDNKHPIWWPWWRCFNGTLGIHVQRDLEACSGPPEIERINEADTFFEEVVDERYTANNSWDTWKVSRFRKCWDGQYNVNAASALHAFTYDIYQLSFCNLDRFSKVACKQVSGSLAVLHWSRHCLHNSAMVKFLRNYSFILYWLKASL